MSLLKTRHDLTRNYGRGRIRDELIEFREMVDRPMGVNKAVETIIKNPDNALDFAKLTADGDWRIESRAAWALAYAAAKKVDISQAEDALLNCLSQENYDLVKAASYALAQHYYNRNNTAGLKSLKNHDNPEVRIGAHLAFLDST